MNRLFLIDGSSFCYRAFYAIRSLSTSRGQPTNAVYGVVVMLRKLLEEENPDYVAVAFDLPKPTFRHQRYERYKEHRKPMPEALVDQLPWIREVLKAFRIPVFEAEGFEADDVLGTLARQGAQRGLSVYLVTGDKDALQLLGRNIRVYRPLKDGHEILDERALREKWGVKPEQVVEVMALMGDETDAIPGVPGIGEKTAVGLIRKYGSVENLMKELEKGGSLRPAVAKAIGEHAEGIRLSRELATLDTAVNIPVDWDRLKAQEPDRPLLRKIYQTLEFRSLVKDLASSQAPCRSPGAAPERLEGAGQVEQLLRAVRAGKSVAVAPALIGDSTMSGSLVGLGVAWGEGALGVLTGEEALDALGPIWSDGKVTKICSRLKEVQILLLRKGIQACGPWFDPGLASYLLDPSRPSHETGDLALEFLGESVSAEDPLERAGREAGASWRLWGRLEEEVTSKGMEMLLKEVEIPLAGVLARMEFHGIGLDRQALGLLGGEIQRRIQELTGQIQAQAGAAINVNSPKQLAEVLFERLKLPVVKRTKTGASTDEEVLRRLSPLHDLPAKVLEYRELAKLNSTYVEALPRLVHPGTGRIHASFNQMVTATGRLSASNPNLQNIPVRTELGRQIRRAFVPTQKGWIFLAADYSQIELRILAHLSEDEGLLEAFQQGQDVHRVTAAETFRVSPEAVTPQQRAAAKTINFGLIYGMTAFGLSKELGMAPSEAEEFIRRYFARYPRVQGYLERSLEEARRRGYCVTLLNRRRNIPELAAKEQTLRQFAERMAINAPIQGSAADLIKVAMVTLDAALAQRGGLARMVCQVHDELILELPPEEEQGLRGLVRETMESPVLCGRPFRLRVPIQVNLKTGKNWFEVSH